MIVRCTVSDHEGPREIDVPAKPEDVTRWRNGEFIQVAMPYLSADEREVLISGTCGPCFDGMFA